MRYIYYVDTHHLPREKGEELIERHRIRFAAFNTDNHPVLFVPSDITKIDVIYDEPNGKFLRD